jgi:hypothetical protein
VKSLKKLHILVDSLKESAVIVVKSNTSCSGVKVLEHTMAEVTVTQVAVMFVYIVVSLAMIGRVFSSSRSRIHNPTIPTMPV